MCVGCSRMCSDVVFVVGMFGCFRMSRMCPNGSECCRMFRMLPYVSHVVGRFAFYEYMNELSFVGCVRMCSNVCECVRTYVNGCECVRTLSNVFERVRMLPAASDGFRTCQKFPIEFKRVSNVSNVLNVFKRFRMCPGVHVLRCVRF